MRERVVKVTRQQFETVRETLHRAGMLKGSYEAAAEALRSIGIEPVDNVTTRFDVVED